MTTNILHKLSTYLKTLPDSHEAKQANNLADVMAGKQNIIESPKEFFSFLERKNLKDGDIHIDSPKGTPKWGEVLPFDYGEAKGAINPADNMPWDIVFPPSQPTNAKRLRAIGIVKIKKDKELWKEKAGKKPPIGNDKVIVSDGTISDADRATLNTFFNDLWRFEPIKWFI